MVPTLSPARPMHPGILSLALLAPLLQSTAAEVPWLASVTAPPALSAEVVAQAGPLAPLLEDAGGKPIATADGWAEKRKALLDAWEALLGPMPRRPAGGFTVVSSEAVGGLLRRRIRYENEPGQHLEAYLIGPAGIDGAAPRSRPALVALHQTTGATIDEIAGVADPDGPQAIGLKLARRGFVVICPKNFLWVDSPTLPGAVAAFHARHPGALGMHKMLYDARRAVDLLLTVPAVDPGRLGAVGHSLGAKEVLYLAAFDERIRAAVASEGGVAFPSTNWSAPWYLGEGLQAPGFRRNHHELLALAAPRALLILGGETGPGAADGTRSWPLLAAAQPVYRVLGAPVRLGLLNHGQGHSIPADAFEKLAEWLTHYLR